MFRIALCDDNVAFLEYERDIVCDYLTKKGIEFQCDTFASGEMLLNEDTPIQEYDLFILDYDMDGLNGFETACRIYEIYPEASIAFATNFYDFTREGYKYNAVRYLVKQEESFCDELAECLCHVMISSQKRTMLIDTHNGQLEVIVDSVLYVYSDKHYVKYVMSKARTYN